MTDIARDNIEEEGSGQAEIVIEEESLREDYTKIPNTILRRADLSPGSKLAYVMLLSYAHKADRCFPGQRRLAEDMGVAVRSVIRYMQELVKAKLLSVTRRGLGKTNIYTLLRWSRQATAGRDQKPEVETNRDDDSPRSANLSHPEVQIWQTEKNKSEKDKTTNAVQEDFMEEMERERRDGPIALKEVLANRVSTGAVVDRAAWLADEMVAQTGERHSRGCFVQLARQCPEELLFEAMALLKQARRDGSVRQSRGALLIAIVRRLCRECGLPEPLTRSQPAPSNGRSVEPPSSSGAITIAITPPG